MSEDKTKMVYIFLAPGFEEIEALCPYDLLFRANIDVKLVSITSDKTVTGAHGITVTADATLSKLSRELPELVMLPGGMPGTKNLLACEALKEFVVSAYELGAFAAAICAAPSVLGAYGMLNGKKAVCYPGFEQYLEGADVLYEKAVRDGKIITSRGMGTALDFGFLIIEALRGKSVADKIREAVLS